MDKNGNCQHNEQKYDGRRSLDWLPSSVVLVYKGRLEQKDKRRIVPNITDLKLLIQRLSVNDTPLGEHSRMSP